MYLGGAPGCALSRRRRSRRSGSRGGPRLLLPRRGGRTRSHSSPGMSAWFSSRGGWVGYESQETEDSRDVEGDSPTSCGSTPRRSDPSSRRRRRRRRRPQGRVDPGAVDGADPPAGVTPPGPGARWASDRGGWYHPRRRRRSLTLGWYFFEFGPVEGGGPHAWRRGRGACWPDLRVSSC